MTGSLYTASYTDGSTVVYHEHIVTLATVTYTLPNGTQQQGGWVGYIYVDNEDALEARQRPMSAADACHAVRHCPRRRYTIARSTPRAGETTEVLRLLAGRSGNLGHAEAVG